MPFALPFEVLSLYYDFIRPEIPSRREKNAVLQRFLLKFYKKTVDKISKKVYDNKNGL